MKWNMKVLTIFPWMLLKIEFCTQPRVSVHKENCLRASINSSTNTTVGLKMKRHTSKFLLLKGTKQAILFLSESQSQLPLLIFFEASASLLNEPRRARKANEYSKLRWGNCLKVQLVMVTCRVFFGYFSFWDSEKGI